MPSEQWEPHVQRRSGRTECDVCEGPVEPRVADSVTEWGVWEEASGLWRASDGVRVWRAAPVQRTWRLTGQ